MARIFVTRRLPGWEEIGKPLLATGHEVVVGEKSDLRQELEKGYEGLLCLLTEKIDLGVLESAKNLKIIANYAVGFDNIDVAECTRRGIVVTNTPCEAVNESVAEFTWALILMLAKNLQPAIGFARNVGYRGWEPDVWLGMNLTGKTLGVIGTGRIGSLVQKRAEAFGMKVVGFNRSSGTTLEQVLGGCDVVSLHVPLTDETRHMMNEATFAQMKKGAYLINTARGPIVDEGELVEALKSGQVGGAALDVWENEPSPRAELVEMENVILTPHVASATHEARAAMGQTAVQNLIEYFAGREPINRIKVT